MKKVVTIGSILLGLVFLAGCGQQTPAQNQNLNQPADNQPNQNVNQPTANLNQNTPSENIQKPTDNINTTSPTPTARDESTNLKTLKGWLEGTRSPLNLVLVETTVTLSGYSGNKFTLVFSKDSLCTLAETELAFSCTDSSQKWGYGDRVRVYGTVTNNQILVNRLEIVSNLPLNQW